MLPPSVAGSLSGLRVLVTGASSGVGLAASETLLANGASVAAVARGARGLEAIAPGEARLLALPADVGDASQGRGSIVNVASELATGAAWALDGGVTAS